MWGTPTNRHGNRTHRRFIPTYVGNATQRKLLPVTVTVHPHECGERTGKLVDQFSSLGSSPRMWGTPPWTYLGSNLTRFIPTYVGNANDVGWVSEKPPVHPHVCGERAEKSKAAKAYRGSSPRMWGTQLIELSKRPGYWFIPTYVGNAITFFTVVLTSPVHPHVCGERNGVVIKADLNPGSSPRMWGTPVSGSLLLGEYRFIPTYVGNAGTHLKTINASAVHPHVCGERASNCFYCV